MNTINLNELDIYTYNTFADRFRFETWQLVNQHIDAYNSLPDDLSSCASVLDLPEGTFIMLLSDQTVHPIIALAQQLMLPPEEVIKLVNDFVANSLENMVQLEQVNEVIEQADEDETRELDTSPFSEEPQTDSSEQSTTIDYQDDNSLDSDEP